MKLSRGLFMPFLAAAVLLASAQSACAQNTAKPAIGTPTCQRWTQSVKDAGNEAGLMTNRFAVMANQNWALGYVSGLNAATSQRNNLLEDIDQQLVSDWIDQYCETHTDKNVTDGIQELFQKLGRKP